jgi:alkanesulfonate monooxygenase SsuD/methylene tetrahydromethanopterin reductase-like flavin-dependent oxidoreductase (luciferase family)
MQVGYVCTGGPVTAQVRVAEVVEECGWDGFFTWDALSIAGMDTWDPWALLAAVAVRTTRVRLGAVVFAPARHEPATLARQVQTVDHLSAGRLVLPVGLGVSDDAAYSRLGRIVDVRERAERLDDTLAILDAASEGGPVTHDGTRHAVTDLTLAPGTVQRPRVPVWVVGAWPSPRSMARAARWDGWVVQRLRSQDPVGPDLVREGLAAVTELRAAEGLDAPFEVVVSERLPDEPAAAAERTAAFAAAGVTWLIHADWSASVTVEQQLEHVRQGPPGG